MRKLAIALAVGLLLSSGVPGTAISQARAASSSAKVVIVVGATQSATAQYRADADNAAAEFAKYTSNIVKVYSPNATWANVQAAAAGASVLVYLGHGSGFPNPYNSKLVSGDNGLGLNYPAGSGLQSDSYTNYYGAAYMATLGLAPNAVVILNHLCYASGDSEAGQGNPSFGVAQTRVDGYASGFLNGNARAVIAEGMGDLNPYIDAIFSAHETIDQMWQSYPWFHSHVSSWQSTQNSGYLSQVDPDLDRPQRDGDVYYRSIVSLPGMTTDSIGALPTYARTTYNPLPPARIFDSRSGAKLSSHVAQKFQVTGAGGVPANATAVTGNLTVTQQNGLGYLYIGPTPTNYPTSSTLNFPVGDDRANAVTVALAADGSLSLTYVTPAAGATTHAIFDVTGYFAPDANGATYHPLTPTRILDSRDGTGGVTGKVGSHAATSFMVRGAGGVPANATAVTGNLTVTQQTGPGYLYLGPAPMADPTSSTLNFPVNDDRANAVTVALGTDGRLSVTYVAPSAGPATDVIFDVTGYFTPDMSGSTFVPLSPTRILDSRYGTGGIGSAFNTHVAQTFTAAGSGGVPSTATAVTGNLTVTQQTSGGYLYIGPVATNNPTSSTLNFPLGDDRANAVAVALGTAGKLSITYVAPTAARTAQAIFDVTGYFEPAK
jgi:serine protease inhibitor ecotin